jgi:hypothetical protein
MKKVFIGLTAIAIVAISVPLFAAFEAHVINVTAHIENALRVIPPDELTFGTVFPQEYHQKSLFVTTSESFCAPDQRRVLNIDYKIVQKPKPRPEPDRDLPIMKPDYNMYLPGGQFEGQLYPHFIDDYDQRTEYCHSHEPTDADDPEDLYYINCYPTLCPYLSKTPRQIDEEPFTDYGVPAFHNPDDPASVSTGTINKDNDLQDEWIIDLATPCFGGMCAQDWPEFVASHNPDANPRDYEAPAGLESSDFGCDLWVEVTGIY